MSGLRLSAGAALSAAGILVAMVCVPAAASADPQNITITSAGPDSSGDPYDLTVVANDGNGVQIQNMTAHVFSASNQDVADVPMTLQSAADLTNQTFAATTPIAETALPAGTYTVTVDASDGVESDLGLTAPGSFTFSYNSSSLSVTPSPPDVTQGSQAVTFSGTLTGTAPGGSPVGIANAPVDLSISGGAASQVATTDANGNFSYPVTGISQTADYNFTVAATASYPAASDDVTVAAQQATTSMTVSADPATVTEGIQNVTFTGNVSATVTPPAPATPTQVDIGSGVPVYLNGSSSPVTTTDDAQGDFTYSSTGTDPGTYTFSIDPTSLYTGVSYQVTVSSQMAPTTMTVQASQPDVTFGSQSVTFTGTVTADPQGGSAVGIGSGVPVYLSVGTGAAAQVTSTTDSSGDFSYTVTGITAGTSYDFSVASTPLYGGASDNVNVPLVQGTTALAVSASPPDGDLSASSVTFSGTASVTPAGSTTAGGIGSGVPVFLSINGGTAEQVTTTTDASGDFSYAITGPSQPAVYDFEIEPGTLYTAASSSVPLGPGQASSLTVTPTVTSVTEGSQTVTFAGHLTGTPPGTSTVNDIQNAPVLVSVGGGPAAAVGTTGSNGDFSYTVKGISATSVYAFSVAETSSYTGATASVPIGVTQAQTRISGVTISPAHLKYGQRATLTGTVQYLSGTTWTPLPNSVVYLAETSTSLGSVTASSTGAFTTTLPTTHGPGWSATVDQAALTQQTTATGNLTFAVPMKVKSFTASLGVNDKVNVTGCLQVTAPVGYGPQTKVEIQYRAGTKGAWKYFSRLPLHNQAGAYKTCPSADESYFSGAVQAKLANAYYRANFAATDSFQGTVSSAVHAWKYQTRIVGFSVSPHAVATGQIVTIKARLEILGKSWKPWAHQKVTIIYNDKGTTFWGSLGSARTSAGGYVTIKAEGGKGSFVAVTYAAYAGNSTHLASRSSGVDVSDNHGTSSARPAPVNLAQLPVLQVPMQAELVPGLPPIASLLAG